MGIEIEKKYRLPREREESLRRRLVEVAAAERGGEVFEENVIYDGPGLHPRSRGLRLRRAGGRAVLTYKERRQSESALKHQREDETEVSDAAPLAADLEAPGYRPPHR